MKGLLRTGVHPYVSLHNTGAHEKSNVGCGVHTFRGGGDPINKLINRNRVMVAMPVIPILGRQEQKRWRDGSAI